MPQLIAGLPSLFNDEEGATAVEYAVMIGLIIVVCLGTVQALATATGDSFKNSADSIRAAGGN